MRPFDEARTKWTDSTVLAHVLTLLNQRYDYGLDLFLLSIDEGITGYRDDSLEVSSSVHSSCQAEVSSYIRQ
jgi:tRNA(Ile)-lysidine synthase TilS/MesJ